MPMILLETYLKFGLESEFDYVRVSNGVVSQFCLGFCEDNALDLVKTIFEDFFIWNLILTLPRVL